MKYFFGLFLCFCLTNCLASGRSEYSNIVDNIKIQYIRQLCRNKEFTLMMVGGGIGGKMSLGFKTTASVDIPEARRILVQKEEGFLSLINGTQEIQPYLNQPSSPETISIKIAFYGSDGNFVGPPFIAYAYVARNTIFYAISDVENNRIVTIFEEPYDEAYKIVYGKERA